MSWLSGIWGGGRQPALPPAGSSGPGGEDKGGGDAPSDKGKPKVKGGGTMDAYRFDSSALERAAEAARELERSSKMRVI